MATIRTGDLVTHYEDAGHGPPLILLHAATLSHRSWARHAADLARDHRVISYDLRGHGETAADRPVPYRVDTLADDLRNLLDAWRLDRPVVCGLSLGAMVAQTFAARHPDRLAGLALIGAPSPPFLSAAERIQRSWLPRTMTLPARLVGYERLKRFLIGVQEKVHGRDAVGAFSAKDLPPMTTPNFVNAVRSFADFHRTNVDLAALRMPTLLLYGEREPAFLRRHGERFQAAVPHLTMDLVPGAGHASPLDAPDFVTAALRRFIQAVHGEASAR